MLWTLLFQRYTHRQFRPVIDEIETRDDGEMAEQGCSPEEIFFFVFDLK